MTKEITLTIPQDVFKRAQSLAEQRAQTITDVLADGLTLVEEANLPHVSDQQLMAREEAAFYRLHNELLAEYEGEFVAIHEGRLIDHDEDELALLKRLDTNYSDDVVLLRKVTTEPEKPLRGPAPRFVRE